jgi:hypothetical protein
MSKTYVNDVSLEENIYAYIAWILSHIISIYMSFFVLVLVIYSINSTFMQIRLSYY